MTLGSSHVVYSNGEAGDQTWRMSVILDSLMNEMDSTSLGGGGNDDDDGTCRK